jgi:putative glutamine amidotransferase
MPQMPNAGYTVATDGYARLMLRPQIGIPLTLDDRGRWREGRSYHYIDRSYADAIAQAGGAALQLPIQDEPEVLASSLDGLLLPGGDDFPAPGELPSDATLDLVCPEQLAFDEALFEAARQRGIPILGICYGMQLMVFATGGVLDAHLPSDRPDVECHKLQSDARHEISIEGTSRLARILGSRSDQVNSLHQQAVRGAGPRYRVVATSPDGVIEAIERRGDPAESWELGVQWHPEKLMNQSGELNASSDRLFRAFVDACRRGRSDP